MQNNPRDAGIRDAEIEDKLEAWAASQSDAELSPELQRKLRDMLASSFKPVKPVPAQSGLVLRFLCVFAAGAAGLIAIMSRIGLHLMTGAQIGWMIAALGGGAILFSLTLARQMVPGRRQRLPLSLVLGLSGVGTIAAITLNFPWRTSSAFVSEGWPCASMELMLAIPAAVVFWLLARRGALFASARLGATLAGLAVFMVLVPLQTQCMFQQAPHLLVWHGGMAAVLIGSAALVGEIQRHRWIS